jgi:hypothetical protein
MNFRILRLLNGEMTEKNVAEATESAEFQKKGLKVDLRRRFHPVFFDHKTSQADLSLKTVSTHGKTLLIGVLWDPNLKPAIGCWHSSKKRCQPTNDILQ